MTRDRVTGVVALILGLFIGINAFQIPASTMSGDPGPQVFVFIPAVLLIICGAGLLITGKSKEEPFFTRTEAKRLLIISAVVLGYIISMNWLGFLLPTIVVLYILATLFGKDKNIPWWGRLIFAVVVSIAVYYLYGTVLKLKLPANKLF